MNVCVFQRYELKYLLSAAQCEAVLKKAGDRLSADRYGKTTVLSLYYDTDDFRLIRRSLEKPQYKEKLRLRSYGLAGPGSTVFLELKKKCSGVVFKRRIETTPEAVGKNAVGQGQIAKEISWFLSFYGNPVPKMLLLYDRTAYLGEGDLRVTFDRNIRYRTERLTLSDGLDGIPVLPGGDVLMEIKTGTAIPLWLTKILNEEKIYKTSFSKYGEAYLAETLKQTTEVRKIG